MLSLKLPRLFSIEQVPQVFHEQGILFGYRHPQSSATACILSLFQMNNETLNIWTHLLPFWFFMWRFVTTLWMTDIQNDSYSWPMLVYMCTSCVYPLASSCAHTFSSMSKNARHICYFLDYGAVNLFSLGCAIAYSAYTFPDGLVRTTFHEYYVALAVLNTVLSTGLSCYSRKPVLWKMALAGHQVSSRANGRQDSTLEFLEIQKPRLCKLLRILAFAFPYTWDSLPILYRLFLFPGESAQNEAVLYHQKHVLMTLLASFFYSAHLPERLAPGRFDYIGHSHQLFHVCAILATHMQMEAILLDKTLRKEWLLASSRPLSFPQIAGALLLCIVFCLSNIIYFSAALYRNPEPELHTKET
ncbi:membrane progestin receptor gamma isoform X2 [Perognathus longimembris pacificus]|uniref:membrane progestin receptor gamma isoform X2 n=1 Tax=Perognathus longimembris pacificus TaxID=214514 RepID=UPI0020183EA0|nr:membrane progestin receptor gamma isoform X2 [Perognathus longimembris pacificus]XP_048186103.1 membrane progestin receptor gamma isoform X2 [Perognathus longimembris pacificus]